MGKYVDAKKALENLDGPLTIGDAIRSIRLCDEMTQDQLAKAMNTNTRYISNVENGRASVSIKQAISFAKALKIPVEIFVKLTLEDQIKRSGIKNFELYFTCKKAG